MGLYEQRVKRLREHVLSQQKAFIDNPEYTRKEYMGMLDDLKVEYRQNDRLDTLKGLYEENKGE